MAGEAGGDAVDAVFVEGEAGGVAGGGEVPGGFGEGGGLATPGGGTQHQVSMLIPDGGDEGVLLVGENRRSCGRSNSVAGAAQRCSVLPSCVCHDATHVATITLAGMGRDCP